MGQLTVTRVISKTIVLPVSIVLITLITLLRREKQPSKQSAKLHIVAESNENNKSLETESR